MMLMVNLKIFLKSPFNCSINVLQDQMKRVKISKWRVKISKWRVKISKWRVKISKWKWPFRTITEKNEGNMSKTYTSDYINFLILRFWDYLVKSIIVKDIHLCFACAISVLKFPNLHKISKPSLSPLSIQ